MGEQGYRRPRGRVAQWWLRGQLYFGLLGRCVGVIFARGRPTVRIVTTNPFFMPALVRKCAGRRDRVVFLLYDLFPDVLVQAGKLRSGSIGERRLAGFTRYALRECAVTVFLGKRLQAFSEERHGPARHGVVIHVGADGAPFRDTPPGPCAENAPLTVLYAGAMGHMHDIDTLLGYWRGAGLPGIRWRFHSSGAGYARLREVLGTEEMAARQEIELGGPLPNLEWENALRSCPISLITLKMGAENLVMPSKTYSALVAGQAILAICAPDSDLGELVAKHDCGWVMAPGDVAGLRACLEAITRDYPGLLAKRRRAYEAGHRLFESRVVAGEWSRLLAVLMSKEGDAAGAARAENPSR